MANSGTRESIIRDLSDQELARRLKVAYFALKHGDAHKVALRQLVDELEDEVERRAVLP